MIVCQTFTGMTYLQFFWPYSWTKSILETNKHYFLAIDTIEVIKF